MKIKSVEFMFFSKTIPAQPWINLGPTGTVGSKFIEPTKKQITQLYTRNTEERKQEKRIPKHVR